IDFTAMPPKVHPHVATVGPTQVHKRFEQRRTANHSLKQGVEMIVERGRLRTGRNGERQEVRGLALMGSSSVPHVLHFLRVTPASSPIPASVVCAVFNPRRKSLSE